MLLQYTVLVFKVRNVDKNTKNENMQNNAETNVSYECDIWFMFGKIKLFLLHMQNNRILNKMFGESELRTERIT
jgi:hypothetical protein